MSEGHTSRTARLIGSNRNRSLATVGTAIITAAAFALTSVGAQPYDRQQSERLGSTRAAETRTSQTPSTRMGATVQMPLVVPLFIANDDFASSLVLVNGTAIETYADVVLHAPDGKEIARQRVNFSPHSQRQVDVGKLLASVVARASSGNILVVPSPNLKGTAIAASLAISYLGSREPNYIDEEVAMPSMEGSQILRTVADQADGSPLVAITSLSETGQRVTIECLTGRSSRFSKSVDLLAGETLLTEACTEQTIHGADFEYFSQSVADGPHTPVGIALTTDGMPGSFAAFGFAPHRKQGDQFFSAINFSDPKMLLSSTTVFTGVPVGRTSLLPEGSYIPELSVTNFSTKDLHVRVQYAQTVESTPSGKEIANLTLAARSSKRLTFDDLEADPRLQNSFVVTSDGAPGDLMAKLVSVSESTLREVESLGKDEMSQENGGSHPWSIERGTESTLLLFNPSGDPQQFTMAVQAGNLLWQKVYQLAPMQTEAISIRSLIQDRIKDDKGNRLPEDILSGEVGWFAPGPGKGKGRILQSNRDLAMARDFSCGNSYVLCGSSFTSNTDTLLIGDTVTLGTLQAKVCYDSTPGPGCTGTFSYYGQSGYTFQWNTDDSSIISFSGPTNTATASVYGNGGGSTGVTAYVYDPVGNCGPFVGGATPTVQVPTSLSVLSSTEVIDMSYEGAGCSNSSYGIVIAIHYQVMDQRSPAQPIKSNKMEPQEKVTNLVMNGGPPSDPAPNWVDFGPSNYPGTARFTDTNGQTIDAPLGVCSAGPVTETATQQYSVLLNGTRYPVTGAMRTNNWTMTSSSAGKGSINNGGDISLSR
jgi:hypothetical protein